MKRFERAHDVVLPPRMPVIIRVDGRAFHTWTRGCDKPFDSGLMTAMDTVAMGLCREIDGAQFAYVQSDEISVLLHNYKRHSSQPWVENRLQKLCSLAASIAAATLTHLAGRPAHFDARAFVLPESEVANYFLWRQQDATRNSIQMLARSLYSHRECDQKNQAELQEMCFQKGHNWNDLPNCQKRGRCVYREDGRWVCDLGVPIFKDAGRAYIETHLALEPELEVVNA
jgi:tRNA(His) 5'-end guanylyltransferase